jgi:glutathione S-transferase
VRYLFSLISENITEFSLPCPLSLTDHVTIADFGLVSATLCLEAIGFGLDPFPLVSQWYSKFKKDFPELWAEVEPGMKEIQEFDKNPPDLSTLNHPLHPTKKQQIQST